MSLDIAVFSDDDTIERFVPIGVETHHRLMILGEGKGCRLVARFRDYYSEAELFHQELVRFAEELRALRPQAEADPELDRIIRELISLAVFASEKRRSLVAVPD